MKSIVWIELIINLVFYPVLLSINDFLAVNPELGDTFESLQGICWGFQWAESILITSGFVSSITQKLQLSQIKY